MRRTLRLLVAATTSAVALSLLIPLGLLVRTLAEDRALRAASEEATTSAALIAAVDQDSVGQLVQLLEQGSPLRLSVRLPDGTFLGEDDPAGAALPTAEQARLDAEFARAGDGAAFTTEWAGSPVVYVPSVSGQGTSVVRVEVPPEETGRGVGTAIAVLVLLGAAMLVAAVAVADALARRVSAPLVGIAEAARRMRGGDLAARVETTGPPEVVEVGSALNDLAERVEELLVAERESVADLAHRLRTPVTALRLASEQLQDPTGERVRAYVGDLERAVDQVVRDARRPVQSTMSARCDAAAVAKGRVAYWTPLAEDRGVSLAYRTGPGTAPVPVDAAELADALDALLDNAFAHAEGVSRIEVSVLGPTTGSVNGSTGTVVAAGEGATTVLVEDDGPGLPSGTVTERGSSGSGSTGLGLDIARRTARAGEGDLVTGRSRLGGALVGVRLRAAPP